MCRWTRAIDIIGTLREGLVLTQHAQSGSGHVTRLSIIVVIVLIVTYVISLREA